MFVILSEIITNIHYRSQLGVEKGAELYGAAEHVLVAGKLVVTDCQVRPVAKYGSYVQFEKQPEVGSDVPDSERHVPVKRTDIPGHEHKAQVYFTYQGS